MKRSCLKFWFPESGYFFLKHHVVMCQINKLAVITKSGLSVSHITLFSVLQFFSSSVRNFRGYLSSWLSIVNVNHFGSLDSSKTSQTPSKLPGISTGFVCASCKGLQLKHITSIGVLLLTKIHWFSSEEAGE